MYTIWVFVSITLPTKDQQKAAKNKNKNAILVHIPVEIAGSLFEMEQGFLDGIVIIVYLAPMPKD